MNPPPENQSFSFLSWNLCMMNISEQAPTSWRPDLAESEIRKFILKLDPDFVCFQELPGIVPFVETHDLLPANTKSHCGDMATIVRKDLMEHIKAEVIDGFAVIAKIESANLTLANVHLEPGRNGAGRRKEMLATILNSCETDGLAIIGDTNSRLDEEKKLAANLGLVGEKPPKATWDTRANRFRDKDPKFTAYFTRYFHNESTRVTDVEVWDEPIVHEDRKFHLSDHFALSGRVSVSQV